MSQEKPSTKLCLECKEPTSFGSYCVIDFALIMKDCGFSNKIIRSLYKLAKQKAVDIEEVVP